MKLRKIFSQLVLLFLLLICTGVSAQTNISGIINSYARVTNINGSQFTINNPAGRSGATLNDFNAGAKVLIYQAKGASINTSNTSSFGQITNLGNAGHYEIAIVQSRSGNTITFSNVSKSYNVSGLVQLVSIPVYDNVTNTGSLTATDWNKNNGYGGILILQANTFTLGANVNVDGKGFVGGNRSNNNGNWCTRIYSTSNFIYGEKGEGITTYSSNLRGQGALANGGGGASTHNGGAGGGSNHARGGNGGIGWNCSSWNNAGGIGGRALNYGTNTERIFFGGGGGGGQQNNNVGSSGGDGGGIVILLVHTLTTNCGSNYTISARGISSAHAGNDGAGGAGAGGVIVINTSVYDSKSCQINLNVDGGNGGNVNTPNSHGGGGGGGSGIILSSINLPSGVNESGTSGTNGNDSYTAPPSGTPSEEKPNDKIISPSIPGALPIIGPGGHIQGLQLWLKSKQDNLFSDTGLNSTINNNQQVRAWRNLANFNNNVIAQKSNTGAVYKNGINYQLNFNPVVRMTNVNLGLRTSNRFDAQTIFVVTKTGTTANLAGLVGFEGDKGIRLGYGNAWRNNDSNDWHRYGGSGERYINAQSGLNHNQKWHIVNQEAVGSYNQRFYVGGYYNNRSYSGDVTEVVVYNDRLSASEQSRVESYLAVKYGITLVNKNYLNSNGQIVWNYSSNQTYHNDIAGIGKDDVAELNQIKSRSVNSSAIVTIANGSNFVLPSSISTNFSYLLWGHNAQATNTLSSNFYGLNNNGIPRIWKVSETGTIGTVRLQVAKASLPAGVTSLFVSTNSTFPNSASTQVYNLIDMGNNWEVSLDFASGRFFSFGRRNTNPVLSNMETSSFGYCNGNENITDNITIADNDNDQVTATISIASGYISGEDLLVYTPVSGVTKKSTSTNQTIELNAASIANMQTALRSIQYRNTKTGSTRTQGDRTIQFIVNDGYANSNQPSRLIHVYLAPSQVGIYHE